MKNLLRHLAAFDDEALAAIASKGLVRRARKDVEEGLVGEIEHETTSARIRVSEFTVTLPDKGPAFAKCTCPASSCCRHILAAVIHLREGQSSPLPAAAPGEARKELLACTLTQISRWAGKAGLREALEILEKNEYVQVEEQEAVLVRFHSASVECRYFAGGGLDGMVVSAKEKLRKPFAAAAVLAYQRLHGVRPEMPVSPAPRAAPRDSGAPRTLEEVLASTRALLEESVSIGLTHLTPGVAARLATLSVSATGVHLPRLSLGLRRLSDEVSLLLGRNAQASEERLFDSIARCYALCRAVAAEPANPELAGEHRSAYQDALEIELVGVGAYRFRAASGYRGLTALFWSPARQSFFSWSDSRPLDRDREFDPAARYGAAGPWGSRATVDQMMGARHRLFNPKVNEHQRLSGSGSTRAERLDDVAVADQDFGSRGFSSFRALREYAASIYPVGLALAKELDPLVVLSPEAWGVPAFDPTTQTLRVELLDGDGDRLPLQVVYNEWNELVIRRLETMSGRHARKQRILARVVFTRGQVGVSPVSTLEIGKTGRAGIVNLNLDAPTESGFSRWIRRLLRELSISQKGGGFDSLEMEAGETPWPDATERDVAAAESELLHLAESGRNALTRAMSDRFSEQEESLRRRGLPMLSDALHPLARSSVVSADTLRARFLCLVHRQAAVKAALSGSSKGLESR
jgi:hypothetical protein